MTSVLIIPQVLRDELERQARAAFPRECCGLIEGTKEDATFRASALHATRNSSPEPDRFEIDPAEQIRILRALREKGRAIIGCYHSHPGGEAEPSARDSAGAFEAQFVWLIVGLREAGEVRLAAFVSDASGFRPMDLGLLDRAGGQTL